MSDDTPSNNVHAGTATGLYAHANLAPGTLLAGRFRIESMLGIGGMGVVYRALDTALDVPVAIKLLRPELAGRPESFERFRQELLLARQVSSPRVVRIHDLAQHEGQWLISMDLVQGESLDRRIDHDPPDIETALRITRQLAEGLQAAHASDVVHRDLKPANVLLDAAGDAYISDFGIARSLASSGATQSGTVVGTPDYLSPEQARGDPVDQRSDLYSLGLILYEMLAGKPAFSGSTMAEALAQRITRPPPSVDRYRPDIPTWVARLADKLLRPQPSHRFQSAGEVIAAIDQRKVPRELHPSRGWVLAAGTLLLLVAVGGWWWQSDTPAPIDVPVSPPLHRVLVLGPTGSEVSPELSAALAAILRDSITAAGAAVVDGERSAQALRQLNAAGGQPDPVALRRTGAADRILRSQLQKQADGWHMSGDLLPASGKALHIAGPAAEDALTAFRAWLQQPSLAAAIGTKAPLGDPQLPGSAAALEAYGRGLLARDDGNLDAALDAFTKATASTPTGAAGWLALVQTAQLIGDDDAAYSALEHGQQAASRASPWLRAQFTAQRALLDGDSIAAVAQWRAQLESAPDNTFAELNLARARGAGGDFKAALEGLESLSERDAGDPRVWFELGKFSILSGDARRAVDDYLVRALILFKRGRDRYGEAETDNALGIGYGRLGQTDDAEEQYRKAVAMRRSVGNLRGVATSLSNLANIASMGGKFEQAAADLAQARELHQRLGDRGGMAMVDSELGLLAEEQGHYPQALAAFRRALQGWQGVEDPRGEAEALNDIGFAQFQLGAYDDAQAYWQRASQAYDKLGDQTGLIRTRQNLGLLATARGDWDQARTALQSTLAGAEQKQMSEEAAVSHRNLAELELEQGHFVAALAQARQAETMFREREDARGISDVGLLRVQALLAMHADGAAAKALDGLQASIDDASTEAQAIAALTRASLALDSGDRRDAIAQLRTAGRLASDSGLRKLQLSAAMLGADAGLRESIDLDAATRELGHAGLRLQWLQTEMTRALADGNHATALRAYREAGALLRNGDSRYAWRLHVLGARAFAAAGQAAAATSADAAAVTALARMRADMPAEYSKDFDARVKRDGAT